MARKKRIGIDDSQIAIKASDINKQGDDDSSDESNEMRILDEINDAINNWISYFSVNISNFRSDKYFAFVDNWTPQQRTELTLHKKDILQVNKLYDALNKVIGEQRQNTAELEVRSLNGEASDEEIKLNQDFLRYICFNSKSRIAYQTAFGDQVSGGFGAFRIRSDYASPDSFDQTIKIEPEKEPEKCFFDPFAKDPTRCDGEFCGSYVTMSKNDFERQFPDVPYPSSFPIRTEMQDFVWGEKDKITIAEFYKKEYFEFNLHKLSDGRVVRDEEWEEINSRPDIPPHQSGMIEQSKNSISAMMSTIIAPPKPTILKTIKKKDNKIVMFKAIYNRIIERKEFPGRELPIIFVPGAYCTIEGQDRTMSFVRYAKDMQIFHNYLLVDMAFDLRTGRKDRFMGTPENISGFEEVWKNIANVQGILPANPDPITKSLPMQLAPNVIPSSSITLFQQSEMAIQSTLGFYEANKGADSIEKSGVAIKEQQRTGNMSVAVFYDNLNRGIEQAGRVVMSMKKEIYDTERTVQVTNQNGKDEHTMINYQAPNGMVINDMTKGDYDVVIDAGPSAAVQKSQSLDILVKLCGLGPNVFPLVADYIGENLSLDSINGIVKRLKTLVPPDVIAMEEGRPPPQQPPNPQLMLAQQKMQIDEKNQQIQMGKLQLEMQKMAAQIQQMQKEIQVTEIKAQAEVQKAAIDHNSKMVETTGKIIGSHNDVRREMLKR